MKPKAINVADNSGTRRRNAVLKIWRNDIAGMDPGSVVMVRFTDDYTHNHIEKVTPRKYVVVDIKFDDDYARQRGRHTVTLRKEKEAEMEKNSRRDAERQRVQSGNMAKLREVCMQMLELLMPEGYENCDVNIELDEDQVVKWRNRFRNALAEPPRNCEIGTVADQLERFGKWFPTSSYSDGQVHKMLVGYADWAQMPYDESGAGK